MAHLWMVYLLNMVIFHSYVSLPEGNLQQISFSNDVQNFQAMGHLPSPVQQGPNFTNFGDGDDYGVPASSWHTRI